MVISTTSSFDTGSVSGKDEDLIVFDAASLGWSTSGAWSMYFDGSDVDLSDDITGIWLDTATGNIYLANDGSFSVGTISGDESDIFICNPDTLGDNTSCTFQMYWDGTDSGFGGEDIDGISIAK